MKRILVLFIFIFALSACGEIDQETEESFPAHIDSTDNLGTETLNPNPDEGTIQEEPLQSGDCYEDGIHPIAVSIADEYNEFTDYDEIMVWFCNGAEFEDIMNALLTVEMIPAEVEELLRRISNGETWNDIWLDLSIVE